MGDTQSLIIILVLLGIWGGLMAGIVWLMYFTRRKINKWFDLREKRREVQT